MPAQSLRGQRPRRGAAPGFIAAGSSLRRCLVFGGAIALTGCGAWRDVSRAGVGALTPLEVLLLALFVACSPGSRLSFTSAARAASFAAARAAAGALGIWRRRYLRAALAHRAADADLQRGPGAHGRRRLQAIHESLAATGGGRRVRLLHPQRHHRSGDLDRRGGGLPGAARPPCAAGPDLLSPRAAATSRASPAISPNGWGGSAAPTRSS